MKNGHFKMSKMRYRIEELKLCFLKKKVIIYLYYRYMDGFTKVTVELIKNNLTR